MILLVASTIDIAGMNIAQQIIEHYKLEREPKLFRGNKMFKMKFHDRELKLVFVSEEPILAQFVTDFFTPELLVFVSRHSSLSGIPTLSVHTPGNLGEAKTGGISRRVSVSPASVMRDILVEMVKKNEERGTNYEVSYECTHHGPSLDVPTLFVELGSTPRQWNDSRAAWVVAHATMAAISKQSEYRAVLGIGGPHYNAKFTNVALSTKKAFGHIISKYMVPQVDINMIKQCLERTVEPVELAVLDWKGIRGPDKGRLVSILDDVGVSMEKI